MAVWPVLSVCMLNRLEMLRIFCVAAETVSFKEAATRLNISPQAVTRAVQELEAQLGELLFHRNTRQHRITEYGTQMAKQARQSVQAVDALFVREAPQAEALTGLVRLTAPKVLGPLLLQTLQPLLRQCPGLRLDLRLSDQIANVVDAQIDIGIRVGFLRDSRFIARPVKTVPFHIVGTPELIARVGRPVTLEALAHCPATAVVDLSTGRPWSWYLAGGQQWAPEQPVFVTDDSELECRAILAGVGFGQVAGFLAEPHIRSGRLLPVLADLAPEPWDLYVYRPQRGPVPARIRLVFDTLVALFADSARVQPPA